MSENSKKTTKCLLCQINTVKSQDYNYLLSHKANLAFLQKKLKQLSNYQISCWLFLCYFTKQLSDKSFQLYRRAVNIKNTQPNIKLA